MVLPLDRGDLGVAMWGVFYKEQQLEAQEPLPPAPPPTGRSQEELGSSEHVDIGEDQDQQQGDEAELHD